MTDIRVERLGKRIRQLRQDQGISQEALANLTKIDRSYMGAIERGEQNITLKKFFHICEALEIEPYEVFLDFNMEL